MTSVGCTYSLGRHNGNHILKSVDNERQGDTIRSGIKKKTITARRTYIQTQSRLWTVVAWQPNDLPLEPRKGQRIEMWCQRERQHEGMASPTMTPWRCVVRDEDDERWRHGLATARGTSLWCWTAGRSRRHGGSEGSTCILRGLMHLILSNQQPQENQLHCFVDFVLNGYSNN